MSHKGPSPGFSPTGSGMSSRLDSRSGGQFSGMIEMGDTEITSTMNFDVDRGLTLSSTTTSKMEMTISAAGPQMTVGTVTTSTLELIDYVSGG